MSRAVLFAFLLLLPAFAGCLSGGSDDAPPAADAAGVAKSAQDAGAKSGEAPVAPKEAFIVEEATAYPVPVETNAARPPVVVDFSGEFTQADCRPLNFGGLEEQLASASVNRRFRELTDVLQVGDVFRYEIAVSYQNSDTSWAEIHPAYAFGSTVQEHSESTQDMDDVLVEWSGQGFRASEDDMAWIFIGCFYGQLPRPIPYTYTVTLSFAEGAIPAESPLLLPVPDGATTLYVRGVPIDPAQGVMSHFRLFGPDDEVVCECALSSSEEATAVPLPGPGAYVLIVDHTDNGFVSAALDVPATTPMRALAAEWVQTSVFVAQGGAVDETVTLDLGSVPLFMAASVMPADGAGVGKKSHIDVANGRGEPLIATWGGHVTWTDPASEGTAWLGFWPGDWEFIVDHHAFAPGAHTVHVTAEELRGEIFLHTRHYVR